MKRAMIVEDNPRVREVIAAYAEHTNKFSGVDSVESGEEALKLFKPDMYSLAVIDIGLFTMSGAEVAYHMRAKDDNLIILGITGYNKILEKVKPRDLGFDECFIKPIGYKEFFDYVRDLT